MWKAFVGWLFDSNCNGYPLGGPGYRLFWVVLYLLALWWSLIGGILWLRASW